MRNKGVYFSVREISEGTMEFPEGQEFGVYDCGMRNTEDCHDGYTDKISELRVGCYWAVTNENRIYRGLD